MPKPPTPPLSDKELLDLARDLARYGSLLAVAEGTGAVRNTLLNRLKATNAEIRPTIYVDGKPILPA
jgi:hypothetical protein